MVNRIRTLMDCTITALFWSSSPGLERLKPGGWK
jgi:hypothetical protein